MNIEQARFNMIEQQIRPWNVLDLDVLSLLGVARREDFVPAVHKALAFSDTEIPLADGGRDGQIMLAPRLEARLLQEARVQRHERVLEIGTGSGYMAALLGHRAQSVLTLERVPALARQATESLRAAGVTNVTVREADGAHGAAGDAPFDVIVLSGSVARVPSELIDQLKPGGRLLAIVGDLPMMVAQRITRLTHGGLHTEPLFDTVAPRLLGFGDSPRFQF